MRSKMEERAVKQICEKLLLEVNCEFVGFAIQNSHGPDITWRIAAGNSNDKYKRITVRYGKGIAGKVIATGQPIEIENFPDNISGKVLDYPIMLAEKLLYAFAMPIRIKGIPKGVLLVGKRTINPISESDQQLVKLAATEIEAL
ncbi:GAF domain-containing protein [Bacillus sp. FJAT-49754]|uniref:GAF domain-containing protein n=2 Tax=Lederbergia citrea TaxID=2833581 RepID=A0A942Z4H2_9BACI|nr:GAF domain-containing protein [Lederbergia citrea]MBS4205913.1 GAF domain-containing protein [Lederbergia citrea]MBS4224638.1 GAF domain-containing protein [Lederbergia citrea]